MAPDDFIGQGNEFLFHPLVCSSLNNVLVKLDMASSGREEAFLATLDVELTHLLQITTQAAPQEDMTKFSGGLVPRSPFFVCTDRHPDVINTLINSESFAHSAQARLVYSRGDTACLLAGLCAEDVDNVRVAEGIHVVEPLPQTAKLSRSLYATLAKNPDQNGDLPDSLEVYITPGSWEPGFGRRWKGHLDRFGSVGQLWHDHLRELFLWTGERSHTLVTGHGLSETADLWGHVVYRSSKDGDACNLGRIRVSPETDDGKIVLHDAGSLGERKENHSNCLLTILAYLTTRPEVAYVDEVPRAIPFNIEAAWIAQSGRETTYPLWNHGINGHTEV